MQIDPFERCNIPRMWNVLMYRLREAEEERRLRRDWEQTVFGFQIDREVQPAWLACGFVERPLAEFKPRSAPWRRAAKRRSVRERTAFGIELNSNEG